MRKMRKRRVEKNMWKRKEDEKEKKILMEMRRGGEEKRPSGKEKKGRKVLLLASILNMILIQKWLHSVLFIRTFSKSQPRCS